MKQKILLKLDQLENYIAQLQGFRNTYQSLLTVLASDRQNFVFKRDSPNFKNTLQSQWSYIVTFNQYSHKPLGCPDF